MITKVEGVVNGDDCYLDSSILQRAEELAMQSTGMKFGMLPSRIAYGIWSQAERDICNQVGSNRELAS